MSIRAGEKHSARQVGIHIHCLAQCAPSTCTIAKDIYSVHVQCRSCTVMHAHLHKYITAFNCKMEQCRARPGLYYATELEMQEGGKRPVVSHEVGCLREILAGCVCNVYVHENEELKQCLCFR